MPNRRLNIFWKEMSLHHKINVIGSIMMIIGLFFPWYTDLDNFRTGDLYIGLNGPLYLAGFCLLAASAASGALSMLYSFKFKQETPKWLKKNWGNFQLAGGGFSFFMIFLINSVYFHPQFGLNITSKESGFGVFIALVGAAFMSVGGFMASRHRKAPIKQSLNEMEAIQDVEKFTSPSLNSRKQGGLTSKQDHHAPATNNFSTPLPLDEKSVNKITTQANDLTTQNSNQAVLKNEKTYQPYRMDL